MGTIHCVEDHIARKVKEIKNTENAFVIGMGDYGEFITPKDKRFDPSQKAISEWLHFDNIAEDQTNKIVKVLTPIKSQIIGLLYGNHEESMRIINHNNVAKNICDRLEVPNLGYSAFVRLHLQKSGVSQHTIVGCFTHGSSSAITEGAKMMALMRFMKSFEADIYGYGHVHDYIPKSLSRMAIMPSPGGKTKIKQHVAIGTTTGCWFRTYTQGVIASYGERKVYPPTEICCAKIMIDADEMFYDSHKSV
jgi:hypothetical protein